MTAIQDKTHDLFRVAALADDDLGYPSDVAFIPADQDWADRAVWRTLNDEHRPVVLVHDDVEVLIEPCPRHGVAGLIDRVLRRTWAQVGWREHGISAPSPIAVRTRLGRHPLQDLRHSHDPALV